MMDTVVRRRESNFLIATLVFLSWITIAHSIDCFKCVSMGGGFPACDDPFHNNHSLDMLESPCMGGRKGRDGLFPATSCIKIAGFFDDTGERITVRGCGLDSGTATTDTEIIRMSHCGRFYYNESLAELTIELANLANDEETEEWYPLAGMTPIGEWGSLRLLRIRYVHGCLQSCNDADACNGTPNLLPSPLLLILVTYHVIAVLKS